MTPRPHRQSATAPPVAAAAEMVVSMANGAKKEAAAAANTTAAADADGGRGAAPTLHGLHPSSSTSSPRCTASAGNAPSTSSARRGDIKNGAAGRQGAEVRMRNTEASAPVAATEGCGRQEPAAAPAVKIPVTFYQFSVVIGRSQVNKSEAF